MAIDTGSVRNTLTILFSRVKKPGVGLTDDEQARVLNQCAWIHRNAGWMLLGKEGGSHIELPNGRKISADYLVHAPTRRGFDCFFSERGANSVVIGPEGEGEDMTAAINNGSRTLEEPMNPDVPYIPPDVPEPKKDEPPVEQPKPKPTVTYDQFVGQESFAIAGRYLAVHGGDPGPSDLFHNAWRRLVEGWTLEAILADIK